MIRKQHFAENLSWPGTILQGDDNSPVPSSAWVRDMQVSSNPTGSRALNVGAGFLCWKLDNLNAETAVLLPIALEACVNAVWLAFGNNPGKRVRYVRN